MPLYKDAKGGWSSVQKVAAENGPYETFDLPTTKGEILKLLNEHTELPEAAPAPTPVVTKDTRSWEQKRADAQDERDLVDDYILNADYEESRRLQSLATERMVETLADMRRSN